MEEKYKMSKIKLGRGLYKFKDLDNGKYITVKSTDASSAIKKLNKKLGKTVNYSFRGFLKRRK